jgi:hypothetical protein
VTAVGPLEDGMLLPPSPSIEENQVTEQRVLEQQRLARVNKDLNDHHASVQHLSLLEKYHVISVEDLVGKQVSKDDVCAVSLTLNWLKHQ